MIGEPVAYLLIGDFVVGASVGGIVEDVHVADEFLTSGTRVDAKPTFESGNLDEIVETSGRKWTKNNVCFSETFECCFFLLFRRVFECQLIDPLIHRHNHFGC